MIGEKCYCVDAVVCLVIETVLPWWWLVGWRGGGGNWRPDDVAPEVPHCAALSSLITLKVHDVIVKLCHLKFVKREVYMYVW